MLRKVLKATGWTAAGVLALVVMLYLGALAINWRDRAPSTVAAHLIELSHARPAVADADNAYIYLRRWELEPDREAKLPATVREFLDACRPHDNRCPGAFVAADGVFAEWYAVEGSVLDLYLELTSLGGWREEGFDVEAIPSYSGAALGQKLLLLRARELARQGDAEAVRMLLEQDLRFWRIVLRSSDILVSKMIATGMLNRHFEWGNLVLRQLPAKQRATAIPAGWHNEISQAERSMERCIAGEWLFTSEMLRRAPVESFGVDEELPIVRRASWLMRPLYQTQDTINLYAAHYWTAAHAFEVPLRKYPDAVADVRINAEKMVAERFPFGGIYNLPGSWLVAMTLASTDLTSYALRVGDIEGVRRAVLTAATLRAAGVEPKDVSAALANAAERDPYTDQPFAWDETAQAIFFRGLYASERGEHRIYY
jgi:hypothetical protein